jgi:hypothetical protein
MENREHHVDPRIAARLRRDHLRIPTPVPGNEEPYDLVTFAIKGVNDRFGRTQRDLVLAAPSAV